LNLRLWIEYEDLTVLIKKVLFINWLMFATIHYCGCWLTSPVGSWGSTFFPFTATFPFIHSIWFMLLCLKILNILRIACIKHTSLLFITSQFITKAAGPNWMKKEGRVEWDPVSLDTQYKNNAKTKPLLLYNRDISTHYTPFSSIPYRFVKNVCPFYVKFNLRRMWQNWKRITP